MTPTPQHGSPAGDATLAIRRLARETGQDVQALQTIYALEGLLTRLAVSEFKDDFVLKGGALLAAFALRRATKDIDLQATHLDNDPDAVAERVRQIAAIRVDDGLVFNLDSIHAAVIRDEDEYAGVRVTLQVALDTARLKVGIDVNFGDPIWPAPQPVQIPRIVDVGLPPVTLLGYPMAMTLSEKIVTAIERGAANTRWRDFGDIYAITRTHPVGADDLLASLRATADYRAATLVPLTPALADMPSRAQTKWAVWRSRTRRSDLPESFRDVLEAVSLLADPVITEDAAGKTWNPHTSRWEQPRKR